MVSTRAGEFMSLCGCWEVGIVWRYGRVSPEWALGSSRINSPLALFVLVFLLLAYFESDVVLMSRLSFTRHFLDSFRYFTSILVGCGL